MAAIQFVDVTPYQVAGEAHFVLTGRLVINYIGQLHHTPIHRRPGLLAPADCTSPDGVDRVRPAKNELVQAFRALSNWPAADAEHAVRARNNRRTAVQLLNLACGNEPLVNHNGAFDTFTWTIHY